MSTKGEKPVSQPDKERQTERERMNWNDKIHLEIKNHRSSGKPQGKVVVSRVLVYAPALAIFVQLACGESITSWGKKETACSA